MMTVEQMEHAKANNLPVVVHAADVSEGWCARMVGFIDVISPDFTDLSTCQEPSAWIIFPDQSRIFLWAHEFRLATLRKPIEIKRQFIHTSSNKYSGNDMAEHAKRRGAVKSNKSDDEPF